MMNNDIFAIFQQQAKEHLHSFEQELLQLEKGYDQHSLKKIMYHCHTLKGAARAIGLIQIKDLLHVWEDIFTTLQKDTSTLSSKKINTILQALDTLKDFLQSQPLPKIQQKSEIISQVIEQMIHLHSTSSQTEIQQEIQQEKVVPQTDIKQEEMPSENVKSEKVEKNEELAVPHASHIMIHSQSVDTIYHHVGKLKILQQFTEEIRQKLNKHCEQYLLINHQFHKLKENHFIETEVTQIGNTLKQMYHEMLEKVYDIEHLASELHKTTFDLDEEVISIRLKKLDELFSQLPRMIRDIADEYEKKVDVRIQGGNVKIDKAVLDVMKNPILQLLRNALGHGIETPMERKKIGKPETGMITINAREEKHSVVIEIKDDGKGIDSDKIRKKIIKRGDLTEETAKKLKEDELQEFLFLPGFTTSENITDLYGRGVGLSIVKSEVEKVGGSIHIQSRKDEYTNFSLCFPLNISLVPVLLVMGGMHSLWGRQIYALPVNQILSVRSINVENIIRIEDRQMIKLNDHLLPLCYLASLFSLHTNSCQEKKAIEISISGQTGVLLVDEVLHQENIIIYPLDERLGKIQDVHGTTTLRNGNSALVLDPHDLVNTINEMSFMPQIKLPAAEKQKVSVLLVEDSITVRELVKKVLQKNQYEVITAVDGQDGLNKLEQHKVDIVITDIDMPRLNGLQMVKAIRNSSKQPNVAVIFLSYKEREQDRKEAFELGAKQYLTKADFDHGTLLTTLKSIIGK